VHVLFANTGMERPETLTFVREVAKRWGVVIRWLERGRGEIDPDTASVNGEPFAKLIDERNYLPNPRARFCTSELKIAQFIAWMRGRGYDRWDNVTGIRWDEPRRVARMLSPDRDPKERWDNLLPLNDAKVTVADVAHFWRGQAFDLGLKPYQSNCTLCMLKGRASKLTIIRDNPADADWWIEQERKIGATFRNDCPSYAAMKDAVERSPLLPFPLVDDEPDDLGDCVCHE